MLTGYARCVTGRLGPDAIIDPEAAASGDPALLAERCLATVDPDFAERTREGDILVLDGALIDGPEAEAAVIALQAVGVAAVVCTEAGVTIADLAAGYGLPLLVAPAAAGAIVEGALVRLDLERGGVEADGARWRCAPLTAEALAAARRAQLLARMRRVVEDEGYAE